MSEDDTSSKSNKSRSQHYDWDLLQYKDKGASLSFLGSGILKVLDSLPFYVLLIDKNHRILLANKATRDRLEMEPNELVGEFCPKIVHGIEEGSYPGCPLEEAVATQKPVVKDHYDEEQGKWLRIAMYPTGSWTVDGEAIYFHMIEDITEYKDAIQKLKKVEEEYRKLLKQKEDPPA
ncbi:PAS fold protein [bacterium BMS3Abin01]|nr:PAS fold protein [bacterium BMS3Abin01]